jgi:hypothetical protein
MKTPTPDAYLASLPLNRREPLAAVRDVIRRNLPAGYEDRCGWGGIVYCIPLDQYPDTYNGLPLAPFCLAGRKSYCTLHAMSVYGDGEAMAWLKREFAAAGKKLDIGQACIHFRSADDLALEVIGALVARTTPARFIAMYETARAGRPAKSRTKTGPRVVKRGAKPVRKTAPKRTAKKPARKPATRLK